MANTNAPYGFKPIRMPNGEEPRTNVYAPAGYSIASAYGTAIYEGDPVKSSGTASSDGRPGLVIAAVSDSLIGIFAGVEYTDSNGVRQYSNKWSAATVGTNIVAYVYDHEDTIFRIQAAGSSTPDVTAADIMDSADFNLGSGNASTGKSGAFLDGDAIGSSNDALLILCLSPLPGNVLGNYAQVEVQIREHQKRAGNENGWQVSV